MQQQFGGAGGGENANSTSNSTHSASNQTDGAMSQNKSVAMLSEIMGYDSFQGKQSHCSMCQTISEIKDMDRGY